MQDRRINNALRKVKLNSTKAVSGTFTQVTINTDFRHV